MSSVAEMPNAPLFELLGAETRRMIVEAGKTKNLAADECLFQAGEAGGTLYVVESGAVELYLKDNAGQKILLKTAECGDFFGEVSLFDGRPRTATAVAATDCKLLALSREDLIETFRRQPETAVGMLAAMGGMLRHADKLLQTNVARNVNEMMDEKISPLQKAIDWVAWFSGSFHFLILTAVWFVAWIAVNSLPLGVPAFDPFPFGFLTMIVSLEAIFLSCFVLISQNRQAAKDHLRSDVEYDVNVKAEMEIAHLHEKTDRINEQILDKFARIENLLTDTSAAKIQSFGDNHQQIER